MNKYLSESSTKMILRHLPTIIIAVLFVLLLPSDGFAVETVIGNMMCNVSLWMHGNTGKGIATLAMVTIGILALFNKISWGTAIIHAVGGVIIVGASSLVTALGAGSGCS